MRFKRNKGFTMAEMLLAVGIVVVLAAVSFIGVYAYQRSMYQLEYDGIAREIFFTAQNHLTMADSQGLVKKVSEADSGKKADSYITLLDSKSRDNVFFYAVPEGDSGGVLELMLPSMSVDTGNSSSGGGSYFVVYQKSSATVLEVFYSPISGRFGHQYEDADYSKLMGLRGDANKANRRNARDFNGAILGYYGGEGDGIDSEPIEIPDPSLFVENKEKLTVTIKNPTKDRNGKDISKYLTLELIVTGETSGAKKTITLYSHGADENYTYHENPSGLGYVTISGQNTAQIEVTVVLDDITTSAGHFAQKFDVGNNGKFFIPGENLSIQAICTSSNTAVLKSGISNEVRTNSLFADPLPEGFSNTETDVQYSDVGHGDSVAAIEYFRHLENLDGTISNLGKNDNDNKIQITKAAQIEDLDWNQSKTELTKIVTISGSESKPGCYLPITPKYSDETELALTYDGQDKKIKNVEIDCSSDAGLFGKIDKEGSELKNVQLTDFNVKTTGGNAGTLLGTTQKNIEIHDVIAYNSSADRKVQNTGAGAAGGLIGSISTGTVNDCGAAVYVTSRGAAGGLIGTTSGTEVTQSYCGGYTRQIFEISTGITAVEKDILITGTGSAGGLIGSMSGGKVEKCAAGVLVNGGTNAGGLIGESVGGTVSASYAAGHTYSGKPKADAEIKYDTHPSIYPSRYYDANDIRMDNVTGGTNAGGLIGSAESTVISNSYSTCSVSGTTAGGFVGTGGSMSNCYCTGLVSGTTVGAFTGAASASATGCQYFEIVNESKDTTNGGYTYLGPTSGTGTSGITALDDDVNAYNLFSGSGWSPAEPYDAMLRTYYQSKYNLQTVKQLDTSVEDTDFVATHYGDWPAPEEFIFN